MIDIAIAIVIAAVIYDSNKALDRGNSPRDPLTAYIYVITIFGLTGLLVWRAWPV